MIYKYVFEKINNEFPELNNFIFLNKAPEQKREFGKLLIIKNISSDVFYRAKKSHIQISYFGKTIQDVLDYSKKIVKLFNLKTDTGDAYSTDIENVIDFIYDEGSELYQTIVEISVISINEFE